MPTCAGATPTLVIPGSWRRSAGIGRRCVPRSNAAGDGRRLGLPEATPDDLPRDPHPDSGRLDGHRLPVWRPFGFTDAPHGAFRPRSRILRTANMCSGAQTFVVMALAGSELALAVTTERPPTAIVVSRQMQKGGTR